MNRETIIELAGVITMIWAVGLAFQRGDVSGQPLWAEKLLRLIAVDGTARIQVTNLRRVKVAVDDPARSSKEEEVVDGRQQ